MPDINPADLYTWELEFATETFRQDDHRYSIDPQNPPPELGHAKIVRMIPHKPGYPPFQVIIPSGALPVWHRKISRDIGTMNLRGLQFRIGWRKEQRDKEGNLHSIRIMAAIDVQTMTISLICDGTLGSTKDMHQ